MSKTASQSSKYSLSAVSRWRRDTRGQELKPRLTDHVLEDRWPSRTPAWASSPEHAFDESIRVESLHEDFRDESRVSPDRVRFYAERHRDGRWFGVVFIIRGNAVVTVLGLEGLSNRPARAYLEELARCRGLV